MTSNIPATILLADDEESIRLLLHDYLKHAGYRVVTAKSGREALQLFHEELPDLVILDLMLPLCSGEEVLKRICLERDTPVMLLTARTDENTRVCGFEMGAYDYVPKPFSPREVVARVNSILRRTQVQAILRTGELVLDSNAACALKNGKDLGLTLSEFRILEALVRAEGRVLSREQIMEKAFPLGFDGNDRTIDSHIKNLRRKIEKEVSSASIITVRGLGYRFKRLPHDA